MADILREPVYVRTHPRPFVTAGVVTNLLLSTLAPAQAQAPFKQTEWPRPIARKIVQADLPPNLLITTIAITPTTLPVSIDWFSYSLRKPVPSVPLPPNLLTSTLLAPTSAPFTPVELQNVTRKRFIDAAAVINTTLLGIPRTAFNQSDWPSPFKRKVVYAEPVQNYAVRGIVPPPPFAQTEWQTLKTRKPIALLSDPPNLVLNTLYIPPPVLPFSLTDWPNQVRRYLRPEIQWSNSVMPRGIVGTTPPLPYTPANVVVTAFRRGYFGGVVIEPGQTFTITTPYQYTPYWMTFADLTTVPVDWSPLLEVFSEQIDTGIIRRPTATDIADVLAQNPGPYRNS